jgi:chemotaxis protein MotB
MALCVVTSGCVSKSRYDELDTLYQTCQGQNTACQAQLDRQNSIARKLLEDHAALAAALKPLVDKGLLTVEVVDGRSVIGMKAEVLFPSGSADLSEGGKDTVQQIARALERRTEQDFQVEGHTDSDPISGTYPNNWYLGAARAITVVEAMAEAGMSRDHLSAASFGQYAPVASNDTDAGKLQNRRIEIVLLPDLPSLPGYENMMQQGGRKRGAGRGR